MSIHGDLLLAGPRGRRLCLELALASADADGGSPHALRTAAMLAAYELDPGRGSSRVMLTVGGSADDPAPTASTPADVGRLMLSVPLAAPDDATLLRAVAAAVDNARYWQEPDGEDVLAASPRMRDAVARVAAHVARSTHAAWWTAPLDRAAQWTVRFAETPSLRSAAAERRSAAERLTTWRSRALEEEATARAERPRDPRAPFSGAWWSVPPTGLTRTTRALSGLGPVGLWLVEDAFGWDRAAARPVTVPPDARVLEIDGPEAWSDLCRRHPLELTAARRHDWYRATGLDARWVVPDWPRVAVEHDAVHLTVAGYLTTAGRALAVTDDLSTVLAGWDPDLTCWLSDVPLVAATEQTWTRRDDGTWAQRPDPPG